MHRKKVLFVQDGLQPVERVSRVGGHDVDKEQRRKAQLKDQLIADRDEPVGYEFFPLHQHAEHYHDENRRDYIQTVYKAVEHSFFLSFISDNPAETPLRPPR